MTEEQRAERIHHHVYETCEGIQEHAERIVELEELVVHLEACVRYRFCKNCPYRRSHAHDNCNFVKAMRGLGIEVEP